MSDIQVDGIMLRCTNPRAKLDFGAIGKGYGIDLAIGHLRELGIHNVIINAGGDLRAIGDRDGQPWRIAIRRPTGGVFAILKVSGDESVFTSGDYERNFVYEGKTYHHIIDPRTGWPAEGTRSVTVVHTDATTADAAATAIFVAGPKEWHAVAERMGIRYVLLMDTEGVVHMNPAMAERVELLDRDTEVQISPPLTETRPKGT
jgi:thiamine biosynthesis lipoprotein